MGGHFTDCSDDVTHYSPPITWDDVHSLEGCRFGERRRTGKCPAGDPESDPRRALSVRHSNACRRRRRSADHADDLGSTVEHPAVAALRGVRPGRSRIVHLALGLGDDSDVTGDPDQVACFGVLDGDLLTGVALLTGRARQIDAVFAIDVLGVTRAVPAGLRRGAAPYVFDAEVGLRLLDDGRALGRDLLGLRRLVLLLVVVLLGVILGLVVVLLGIVLGLVFGLRGIVLGLVVLVGLVVSLRVVLRILVVCSTFPGVCRRVVIGGRVPRRGRIVRGVAIGHAPGDRSLRRELGGAVPLGPDQ